ncbi:unnamed protein product [Dovyalis caffra]|uniref:Cycloartenol synthase n=1 Tax=Dovyalis caffra TaxID=77055 RepID=A0AAV1S308_9ROSI|nr:unnamed protein product [Dovyalis caffra]
MLCCWVEDPNSEAYKCHLARIKDYLWVAEDGMKMQAAILLSRLPSDTVGEAIPVDRLHDAVNAILSLQNKNGGFASYELTRSYAWLEILNPAEIFGDIMIDYQLRLGSEEVVYTNLEGGKSHLVNTGWAMLALIEAGQVNYTI